MNAWIIYNGSLKLKKMIDLVEKLVEDAKKLNVNLIPIKNNEIIPSLNNEGELTLEFIKTYPTPEFVVFWDKDIVLAKLLEKEGYKVFNNSKAIDICDNKTLMHLALADSGIKVPKTIFGPFTFDQNIMTKEYTESVFFEVRPSDYC